MNSQLAKPMKLSASHPHIAREWHPTLNENLTPDGVVASANDRVWWRCAKDSSHEWRRVIHRRTQFGSGCPYCEMATKSLAFVHPGLASQWHSQLNTDLTPDMVAPNADAIVWWQCLSQPEHIYQRRIRTQTAMEGPSNCPLCAKEKRTKSRSLAFHNPDIAAEWHPIKNTKLSPCDVSYSSQKDVWWQCAFNAEHEWQGKVYVRTENGAGCPFCNINERSLKALYPEIARQLHPKLNGCSDAGAIRANAQKAVWWQCPQHKQHVYQARVFERTVRNRNCSECASEDSLQLQRPDLAAEWHPILNDDLTATNVSCRSSKRTWWQCRINKKHEWRAVVSYRVRKNSVCPFCNESIANADNNLAVLAPELAAEWHPTKNRKLRSSIEGSFNFNQVDKRLATEQNTRNRRLRPTDVTTHSQEKVWWQCKNVTSHEWEAVVAVRFKKRSGCPFCASRKVSQDNSLASMDPGLAKLWHPTRNLPLRSSEVMTKSDKVIWWRCPRSATHAWQARVSAMTVTRQHGKLGCPFCVNRRTGKDNNFAVAFPEVAQRWHPKKNEMLSASSVAPHSSKKVWWLCPKSKKHEWQSSVCAMVKIWQARGATGCPYCSGKLIAADTCLRFTHPKVAQIWHPVKNVPLSASEITSGSSRKIWWQCTLAKHEWQARIASVVASVDVRGTNGCPYCSGRKPSSDNNLWDNCPDAAKFWDPARNLPARPWELSKSSDSLAWWRCQKNAEHVWRATIKQAMQKIGRNVQRGGSGCHLCSKRKIEKSS